MQCQLVYDGSPDCPHIPEGLKRKPLEKQMQGTSAEQLVELAGRLENDSLGVQGSSGYFHRRALGNECPNHAPYEHPHLTFDTILNPSIWLGVQGVTVSQALPGGYWRVTLNIRHCLEWPRRVIYLDKTGVADRMLQLWGPMISALLVHVLPSVYGEGLDLGRPIINLKQPERDSEAFVSLYAETTGSLAPALLQAGFRVTQRASTCNDAEQGECIPAYLQEFLNEAGFLALDEGDGPDLWCDAAPGLTEQEIRGRTATGNSVGSLLTQTRMVYAHVTIALRTWLEKRKGFMTVDAQKIANDAARYYLGNSLATNLLASGSVRQWREFCQGRIGDRTPTPAIKQFKQLAETVVSGCRYGELY